MDKGLTIPKWMQIAQPKIPHILTEGPRLTRILGLGKNRDT